MPVHIYTVKPGDTLSSIAKRHGISSWQKLYDDPSNASFRAKRPNPNVIFPGDQVNIPSAMSTSQVPKAPTGKLKIISETGVPHCACQLIDREWYGFKPALRFFPAAFGHVDRQDPTPLIKLSVTLRVDPQQAINAMNRVVQRYERQWYVVGVHDCVSFLADFCESLDLKIPPRPNMWPDSFVQNMRSLNADKVVA